MLSGEHWSGVAEAAKTYIQPARSLQALFHHCHHAESAIFRIDVHETRLDHFNCREKQITTFFYLTMVDWSTFSAIQLVQLTACFYECNEMPFGVCVGCRRASLATR